MHLWELKYGGFRHTRILRGNQPQRCFAGRTDPREARTIQGSEIRFLQNRLV